jgi:hypothetical protein
MRITFYKDGSFNLSFPKEEAELGASLISVIPPADQVSAYYLHQAYRRLMFLHRNGYFPDAPAGNVFPFTPKEKPPH